MNIEPKQLQGKDGTPITVRALVKEDAAMVIDYMRHMYATCSFLAREVEEWTITVEDEIAWLTRAHENARQLIAGAFDGPLLVGLADVCPISNQMRMSHRCQCAISVAPTHQGRGIGKALMETLIEAAKRAGYEQMELEVVSINDKALGLYRKLGFVAIGTIERGMKYKDGSYADLQLMIKPL